MRTGADIYTSAIRLIQSALSKMKRAGVYPLLALLLVAYFVYFCWPSLGAHFASDDMPNIAKAWKLPAWQLVCGPFLPWMPFYRPLPNWLLIPVFHVFGLNPVPFRVAMLLFVLANVFLVYELARRLESGEWASWIAAFLACYHVGVNNLYYSTAFVYDVLCCFFYLAALLYYVRIRQSGLVPDRRQTAVFLGLSLFALESKEMAVMLPVVVLLYECLYRQPAFWPPRDFFHWMRREGRCVLAGGCLNLLFLRGNVFGSGVIHNPAYIPKFSMGRVWAFQIQSLGDLFEKWAYFDRAHVVALWLILFYLAWRRPRPVLRFACLFLLVSPLPIEFLLGRAQGCLYIPMVAWAVFVAVIFVNLVDSVAGFLLGEPLVRHLRRPWLKAALTAVGLVLWARQNAQLKKQYVDPVTADFCPRTWNAIQQLRLLSPHVRPHSTVVFLDDPLGNYDMEFIGELWFHDHTVSVSVNHPPLSGEEIAKAGVLIDYRDGQFVQVR